jgi:hypothetical protein
MVILSSKRYYNLRDRLVTERASIVSTGRLTAKLNEKFAICRKTETRSIPEDERGSMITSLQCPHR